MGGNSEDTRNNSRREAEYGLSSLKLSIAEGIAPSIPFNGVTDAIKRTAQAGSPALFNTKPDKSVSTDGAFPGHAMTPRALWPR